MELHIPDESAMEALGAALARVLNGRCQIHLHGDLGAGKTTLARGFLRALGHQGPVKSPTYTLVEPYRFDGRAVYHLDLYRLSDPEELEYLGLRDLQEPGAVVLVEWPEQGGGLLPDADLLIRIEYSRSGRRVHLEAGSAAGGQLLSRLEVPAGTDS